MHPIYFDHAATTPMRAEVRAAMAPFLEERFGNPSSAHRWGRDASAALEDARAGVARALGARASEIHFVRGGTESDNLAVQGRTAQLRRAGQVPRVVVSAIEHKAVLESAARAAAYGDGHLVILGISDHGALDLEALDDALMDGVAVVSVMWVNNETGLVLPVPEIAERTRAAGASLHTDAVQAVGKVDVRVDRTPVDLLTLTGHKIYGPKGTGVLFVRSGVQLEPLLRGGGQERGLRPGTEDVAGAVGVATALRLAVEEREAEAVRLNGLRARLEDGLQARVPGLRINAGHAPRAPHVTSLGIEGVDGQALLAALDLEGIAASGGSACDSGSVAASHVIQALYGPDDTLATVRFSLGRSTTAQEVDRAAEVTGAVVERLRHAGART
jgi:cysteine desulfurase